MAFIPEACTTHFIKRFHSRPPPIPAPRAFFDGKLFAIPPLSSHLIPGTRPPPPFCPFCLFLTRMIILSHLGNCCVEKSHDGPFPHAFVFCPSLVWHNGCQGPRFSSPDPSLRKFHEFLPSSINPVTSPPLSSGRNTSLWYQADFSNLF